MSEIPPKESFSLFLKLRVLPMASNLIISVTVEEKSPRAPFHVRLSDEDMQHIHRLDIKP